MDEGADSMGRRAIARCDRLGAPPYSLADDRLDRPFLTSAHAEAAAILEGWMSEAGLTVRLDPIGNLVGRMGPEGAPALVIGSHIDSVRDAGRYDGPLGVMIGVECAAALHRRGRPLPFALEVIAFGDEEGSRFPVSMMGSRGLTAPLPLEQLELTDAEGLSVAEALTAFGLDPARVNDAVRGPGAVLAYVEPHIEQGPALEAAGLPLGVVTAIVGQARLRVRFQGVAGHAGTTPMPLRHDALAAAAEAVLAVERICAAGPAGLVGTVGRLLTPIAAYNVILGEAEIGVDVRAAADSTRDAAAAAIRREIEAIAARRGVGVEIEVAQALPACPCDAHLADLMEAAVASVGVSPLRLVSGAGHDAMVLARIAPVAMLFIRCAGGISHNPAEHASAADADLACRAMLAFIDRLAGEHA